MRKILFTVTLALALSACVTNQGGGTIAGGAVGGLLGSTVGKGSGRVLATVGGAVLGAVLGSKVGENMDKNNETPAAPVVRPPHYVERQQVKRVPSDFSCESYADNPGAYASCQRGVAERKEKHQRNLENEAYRIGRER